MTERFKSIESFSHQEDDKILTRLISPVYLEHSRFTRNRRTNKFQEFLFCDNVVSFDKIKTCVYFVFDGEYTKIGYTINMKNRMRSLQGANPRPLKFLFAILFQKACEARQCEGFFHHMFSNKQICGEWFDISEQDMSEIKPMIKHEISKVMLQEVRKVGLSNERVRSQSEKL